MTSSRARKTSAHNPDPEALLRATKEPDFRQERSRRSYLALIEAATELFGAHGYDGVGTPEIAQRAGVAVGTFYRYFDDKKQVYLEVTRRTMAEAYEETIKGLVPERFVGRARHETIAEAVAILFAHVLRRPELSRSFMEMALRDRDVAALNRAFEQVALQRLTTLIAAICPRTIVPDPAATAYILYNSAMQTAYGIAGHFGTPPIDTARAKAALTSFIERALFPAD